MNDLQGILKSRFRLDEFRPGQREIMEILLAGRSALAVFPTGGGKSLCYQLPALMLEGVTLVVSPLIALMRDQVDVLRSKGIEAARLDSSLDAEEVRQIYGCLRDGSLKLLYVAPERLSNEGFLGALKGARISLLAVDEAHCISEWGHNFRPDYLKLGELRHSLGVERVLALTATATPRVSADICREFAIDPADHVQTGFRRENLSFAVWPCRRDERNELLLGRLGKAGMLPSIIYVTLQQTAEEVAGRLAAEGHRARAYHAGLADEWRTEVQDAFMTGETDIVVATIAFGMGIDKADIRSVVHYNLPKSLENYVQESGRAGRDGKPAKCEILACGDDRVVLENFTYGDTPSSQALSQLLEHLLLQGEEFSISRYELAHTNDIRPLVIATVLTYLELDGILEATGPFYARYQYRFTRDESQVLAGYNARRQAFLRGLFRVGSRGRTWTTVDLAEAAAELSEPESKLRRTFQYLEEAGDLVLKASALRHGYRLNRDRSPSLPELRERMDRLFRAREEGEIGRLDQVLSYCESKRCRVRELVGYFGEEVDEPCGICDRCRDESAGSDGWSKVPTTLAAELNLEEVELIRRLRAENHPALRQPRQLTRFLCGITSPAATRARLTRHDQFGCLREKPFPVVLAQVESLGT